MKKTMKRAESNSGQTFASGLPYGSGAIQLRGNSFWLLHNGKAENTNTDDFETARRLLAKRAIDALRARIAAIETAIGDAPEAPRVDMLLGEVENDQAADLFRAIQRAVRNAKARNESKAADQDRGPRASRQPENRDVPRPPRRSGYVRKDPARGTKPTGNRGAR